MTTEHWRNSPHFSGGGIESLVEGKIHNVEFNGFGRESRADGQPDPHVRIIGPNGEEYFGFLNFNSTRLPGSNVARQKLIAQKEDAGKQKARISRLPARADPLGPYLLQGVPESPFDLTPNEAFSVARGIDVYYALCVGHGAGGAPRVFAYSVDQHGGLKGWASGFLNPITPNLNLYPRDKYRELAEMVLSENVVKEVHPGERLLVVDITRDSRSRTRDFVPLINFSKEFPAYHSDDRSLSTGILPGRVSGEPDLILHLPILDVQQFGRLGTVGVGYVRHPGSQGVSDHYKKVLVTGAADLKGQYVERAVINDRLGDSFLANAR